MFLIFSSSMGFLCVLVGCAPETVQNLGTAVVESLRAFLVLFWGSLEVGYFGGRCMFFPENR